MLKKSILTLAIATAMTAPTAAQEAPLSTVSVDQLVEELQPKQTIKLRGIGIQPTEVPPPSVDLAIPFDYDSDALNKEAKAIADVLAAALESDQLRTLSFRLIGHTDAKGSDDYNQILSLKRALAVESYLVGDYGIALDRLSVEGKGESELLFPDQPDDARNRRVEVQTVE